MTQYQEWIKECEIEEAEREAQRVEMIQATFGIDHHTGSGCCLLHSIEEL